MCTCWSILCKNWWKPSAGFQSSLYEDFSLHSGHLLHKFQLPWSYSILKLVFLSQRGCEALFWFPFLALQCINTQAVIRGKRKAPHICLPSPGVTSKSCSLLKNYLSESSSENHRYFLWLSICLRQKDKLASRYSIFVGSRISSVFYLYCFQWRYETLEKC